MFRASLTLLLILIGLSSLNARGETVMKATDLRCEGRVEPIGIDNPEPLLSWVTEARPLARGLRQSAYQILVASRPDRLTPEKVDQWNSGKILSSNQNNVAYRGSKLQSGQHLFWRVRIWDGAGKASEWSALAKWKVGLLSPADWKGLWLSDGKPLGGYEDDPMPMFRKEFIARKKVKSAHLSIAGLGYFEATLNGKKVGDHVLEPGWTKFDKTVLYSTHDVTSLLQQGRNCMGVMVGNGWYNPLPMRMWGNLNLREHLAIGRPCFLAQIEIVFEDGTRTIVPSDFTWKMATGPVLRNNVYLGETFDSRHEQRGWNKSGFDDSEWIKPSVAKVPKEVLRAQAQPPIKATREYLAARVSEPSPKTYIYDFGQNFAGWVRLRLNVPKGVRVQIRYGELLHKDGSLNPLTSVAGQIKSKGTGGPGAPDVAWQSDAYISNGEPTVYEPRFTFHGFRYVEITGLSQPLTLKDVVGVRLNSDVETVGSFECSNPLLNQIQRMCQETFRSNLFSVQSDCPHREKMGYGGDIGATSEAFMLNFDMANFYAKTVQDFAESALPNGMFTDTAPFVGIQYCGPAWAMAHPLLVDQLHRYYGNTRIGSEQYEAAKRWMALVEMQNPEGIIKDGLSDHEGLAPAPAPEMVTPLYFYTANMMSGIATRLNKKSDAAHYTNLAKKIQTHYMAKFFDPKTGKVGPGSQTPQSFALYTGLLSGANRVKALDYLLDDIRKHQDHLTTGIFGTKFMLDVLSREGHAETAYKIATQPDFPGWGWMLKSGATTLWEHWELSENTFSHNHPMFGSVSQWMFNWLGGIQPSKSAVGFDDIEIRPQPVKELDWVKTSYRSVRGLIVSNWRRERGRVVYEITIPPNSSATVLLAGSSDESIAERGEVVQVGNGIRQVKRTHGGWELSVGSGVYKFEVRKGGELF